MTDKMVDAEQQAAVGTSFPVSYKALTAHPEQTAASHQASLMTPPQALRCSSEMHLLEAVNEFGLESFLEPPARLPAPLMYQTTPLAAQVVGGRGRCGSNVQERPAASSCQGHARKREGHSLVLRLRRAVDGTWQICSRARPRQRLRLPPLVLIKRQVCSGSRAYRSLKQQGCRGYAC